MLVSKEVLNFLIYNFLNYKNNNLKILPFERQLKMGITNCNPVCIPIIGIYGSLEKLDFLVHLFQSIIKTFKDFVLDILAKLANELYLPSKITLTLILLKEHFKRSITDRLYGNTNFQKKLSICKWKSKNYRYLGEFKSLDNRTFYNFFGNNFYSNITLIYT